MGELDLGIPRVFFVTLGRFKEPPIQTETGIPVLDIIEKRNGEYSGELEFEIDRMEVISIASRYVFSSGYVFLSPPIPFDRVKRSKENPKFIRPSIQRGFII